MMRVPHIALTPVDPPLLLVDLAEGDGLKDLNTAAKIAVELLLLRITNVWLIYLLTLSVSMRLLS